MELALLLVTLRPCTNSLAKAGQGEATLATNCIPLHSVSIPRDGASVRAASPRRMPIAPSPLSGFEAGQTELHGTSGTHGEYNHGQV